MTIAVENLTIKSKGYGFNNIEILLGGKLLPVKLAKILLSAREFPVIHLELETFIDNIDLENINADMIIKTFELETGKKYCLKEIKEDEK